MITPSFGLTATERVLPKLALDFTTASLDSRITFTRTTSASNPATYVNSSGVVTAATNNQPRFDYDPVTLACKGLLIEESRQNLILQSQAFNVGWSTLQSSIGADIAGVVSPDGIENADSLTDNTVNAFHAVYRDVAVSAVQYTYSFYAKAGTATQVAIRVRDTITGGTTHILSVFDLSAVSVNQITGTGTITDVGGGWYRCTATGTLTAGTRAFGIFVADNGAISYAGTGKTLYIWGAQLEAGAFATSYIPTTTTALTRNADVATMTGTNFSDWFNAGNGAFGCSVLPKAASGVKPVLQCDDATALNTIVIQGNATATEMKITTLAVLQNALSTGTITANAQYGVCGAWSAGSDALSKSGASPSTGSPLTIPTVTQARLGSDGTNYFNGWLKKVNYWPQRVTNSETQAFSK